VSVMELAAAPLAITRQYKIAPQGTGGQCTKGITTKGGMVSGGSRHGGVLVKGQAGMIRDHGLC
jgi:hypothetical protein